MPLLALCLHIPVVRDARYVFAAKVLDLAPLRVSSLCASSGVVLAELEMVMVVRQLSVELSHHLDRGKHVVRLFLRYMLTWL